MDENEATPVAVLAAPARSAALSPEDVADAKAAMEATYGRPDVAGVCVADGFGVKVRVEGRAWSPRGLPRYREASTHPALWPGYPRPASARARKPGRLPDIRGTALVPWPRRRRGGARRRWCACAPEHAEDDRRCTAAPGPGPRTGRAGGARRGPVPAVGEGCWPGSLDRAAFRRPDRRCRSSWNGGELRGALDHHRRAGRSDQGRRDLRGRPPARSERGCALLRHLGRAARDCAAFRSQGPTSGTGALVHLRGPAQRPCQL
jgi:hypothetical protein